MTPTLRRALDRRRLPGETLEQAMARLLPRLSAELDPVQAALRELAAPPRWFPVQARA